MKTNVYAHFLFIENFKLNKMVKQTFIKDQIEKKKINNF